MHNPALQALKLNWRYLAFEVMPEHLPAALAGAKAMRFIGLNLTLPHKLLAVGHVDELDASAKSWGAVNTIRFEGRTGDGQWVPLQRFDGPGPIRSKGFNTDADALIQSLREDLKIEPRGSRVLQLGAGGAGRVAALRLAAEGVASLHLVNRTRGKAEELAGEIRARFPEVSIATGYPEAAVDLILNCTSLGLKQSDPLPMKLEEFPLKQARCVYDMIYQPAATPLLELARQSGCRVANGLGMLLYQGAAALELWSERAAPLPIMRQALGESVYGPGGGVG